MPPLVVVAMVALQRDRTAWRDYWRRLVDFGRIGAGWYALILLVVPALTGLSAMIDALAGGQGAQPEALARFQQQPLSFLPFAVFMLIFGPLPEEMGWRGYAQGQLRTRHSMLTASLIVGVVWTLWHLPLFFIDGSYQHGLGLGTLGFWLFMLDKVPQSVVMGWVYDNTRQSTLSAVILHFMVNLVGELFALSPRASIIYVLLWILTALVALGVWARRTPRRRGASA